MRYPRIFDTMWPETCSYLQSFLIHNVDLDFFRGLFTYAVIEVTTQVTHVNSPMPSVQNIAGTHWQHGSCRWRCGEIVQTASQHRKMSLMLVDLGEHLSRHDVDLIVPYGLFYVMNEVIPRNNMSVKSHVWIPVNYIQVADPGANSSLVA